MELRIVHDTEFRYAGAAKASYNEVRLLPQSLPGQIVEHARVDVSPQPWLYSYRDYFGTSVTAFEIVDPHEQLTVTATTIVHTEAAADHEPALSWEDIASPELADTWIEDLTVTDLVRPPEELLERVRRIRDTHDTPDEAARAVCDLVYEEVQYQSGSTVVTSTAAEAWEQRLGVCQDMAHIVLGCLRSLGIPARYVSGYLHPQKEPEIGETVTGESHAWVEWYDDDWVPFDPTNDQVPGERHVVIAVGRDYTDVKPLSGLYSGAATEEMNVSVKVTRLS